MTTLNEARQSVYKRFMDGWGDATPFCFENEPFNPPDKAAWARCSMRSLPGGQSTLGGVGNRKYLRHAMVRIEIYTVPGKGLQAGDALAQQALGIFEGVRLVGATCVCYDGQTAEAGLVDNGRWSLSTAQTMFDYEEVK